MIGMASNTEISLGAPSARVCCQDKHNLAWFRHQNDKKSTILLTPKRKQRLFQMFPYLPKPKPPLGTIQAHTQTALGVIGACSKARVGSGRAVFFGAEGRGGGGGGRGRDINPMTLYHP